MKFMPKTLDYELSPYTGLTRESWLEAGIYMLEGIFSNIDDFQVPGQPRVQVTFVVGYREYKRIGTPISG